MREAAKYGNAAVTGHNRFQIKLRFPCKPNNSRLRMNLSDKSSFLFSLQGRSACSKMRDGRRTCGAHPTIISPFSAITYPDGGVSRLRGPHEFSDRLNTLPRPRERSILLVPTGHSELASQV